jgi:pimeloyl-ACP methyl ester carboxylesterase
VHYLGLDSPENWYLHTCLLEQLREGSPSMKHDMTIINTVLSQGSGTPLVLLHAFPVDHRMWEECAQFISMKATEEGLDAVTIFAPDMPGAGDCPVPDAQISGAQAQDGAYLEALDRMADAFVAKLREQGYQQAVWVGLSMGGYLALAIQRLHPDAVAGIALCDTKADADSVHGRKHRIEVADRCVREESVKPVMNFAQAQQGDSDVKKSQRIVDMFSQWISTQSPQGIAWRERMAAGRPDQSEQLELINTPALVLSGDLDPSSPPTVMRPLAQMMSQAEVEFVELPNCGHFSAVEYPQEVAQALLRLVQRVRAAQ